MMHRQREVILNIGGAGIHISSPNAKIFTLLQDRYKLFVVKKSGSVQPFRIEIYPPIEYSPVPPENKIPVFVGSEMYFYAPGWEGAICPDQRTGWVRPASRYIIEELDYYLRIVVAVQAYEIGGLLIHAAGVVRNNYAFAFIGPSGVGKTTVSRLSGQNILLNDDLVLLFPNLNGWFAHTTPFWNPSQVQPKANHSAPLRALLRLKKDVGTYLKPTSPGYALAELIGCIPVISADPHRSKTIIARCEELLKCVPLKDLHFQKDDTFWQVLENFFFQNSAKEK